MAVLVLGAAGLWPGEGDRDQPGGRWNGGEG